MDKVLFSFCILAYSAVVILLISETKYLLRRTPTVANKIYTSVCGLIYVALFVYLTSDIIDGATISFRDMNGEPLSIAGLASYIFFWFVFWVLNGSILTVLLFIPHTIFVFVCAAKK